jgi:hypothetical protein
MPAPAAGISILGAANIAVVPAKAGTHSHCITALEYGPPPSRGRQRPSLRANGSSIRATRPSLRAKRSNPYSLSDLQGLAVRPRWIASSRLSAPRNDEPTRAVTSFRPHPEERASARVSKERAAPSFETRSFGPLLRMRPNSPVGWVERSETHHDCHARACRGHPRLTTASSLKTWMAGSSLHSGCAKHRPGCPAMTETCCASVHDPRSPLSRGRTECVALRLGLSIVTASSA